MSPADPMLPRPFRVVARRQETADTATLDLEPTDGEPLAFAAGQFTMIGRPGRAEVPISISGDPARPELLVHTVRAVGDASRALAGSDVGDLLLVRGPYGTGWDVLDGAGGDVVLVAGGIGLAPLRPALLEVLAHRDAFDRVVVAYGARTPQQILYAEQLEQWRGRFDLEVAVTVDAAPAGWHGRVGLVTDLLPRDLSDPERSLALVCGPEVMMRFSAQALVQRGLPESRVRVSLERNMKCGVGLCGHCQLRELFLCVDGPVLDHERAAVLTAVRGL